MKTTAVVLLAGALIACGMEKDISVTVSSDKTSYSHDAALGKPAVAAVTVCIANKSNVPLTLQFNSAQRYDFVLYDKSGKELTRWSAERMFAQVLGALTLATGEKKEFRGSLPLASDGKPLPPGEYLLEGVVASNPPRTAKRITLRVAN